MKERIFQSDYRKGKLYGSSLTYEMEMKDQSIECEKGKLNASSYI